MPITPEQRLARRQRLGSSDSAAILGVDPYRSAYDVYLSKIYALGDPEGREAIEIGNDFEEPLLRWAARELGVEIETNVYVDGGDGIRAAQLDALVVGKPQSMEGKTTSLADEYGDPGTDQVPDRVIVQTQKQMDLKDLELVWVPVLTARFDRLHRILYRVTRNERLIEMIRNRDREFWEQHVLPRKPPEDSVPSADVIARIERVEGAVAQVDRDLVEAYERAALARKNAELTEDAARAEMLAAAEDAEILDYGDPHKLYAYRQYRSRWLDGKRLEREHPEIHRDYLCETPYRKLLKINRPGTGRRR